LRISELSDANSSAYYTDKLTVSDILSVKVESDEILTADQFNWFNERLNVIKNESLTSRDQGKFKSSDIGVGIADNNLPTEECVTLGDGTEYTDSSPDSINGDHNDSNTSLTPSTEVGLDNKLPKVETLLSSIVHHPINKLFEKIKTYPTVNHPDLKMAPFSGGLLNSRTRGLILYPSIPTTYWPISKNRLTMPSQQVTKNTAHQIELNSILDTAVNENQTNASEILLIGEYLSNLLSYNPESVNGADSIHNKSPFLDYNL
jgi:hypothetical protein